MRELCPATVSVHRLLSPLERSTRKGDRSAPSTCTGLGLTTRPSNGDGGQPVQQLLVSVGMDGLGKHPKSSPMGSPIWSGDESPLDPSSWAGSQLLPLPRAEPARRGRRREMWPLAAKDARVPTPPSTPPPKKVHRALGCPGGHRLVVRQMTRGGCRCDGCDVVVLAGRWSHCCRVCDYDLCTACGTTCGYEVVDIAGSRMTNRPQQPLLHN